MLQAGLISQLTSGIYTWLPLGLRVLKKVENLVRDELNKAGCQELLYPLTQPLALWEESGRQNAYGKELLTMQDRYDNTLLFCPTAEEVAVHTCSKFLQSYKDLPQCFYQIQWKFRDEIRPRFGVMRAREFLMQDAYSFDLSETAALETYHTMAKAYLRIFKRMGFTCLPVRADSGAIGGNWSHEFAVLCDGGESAIAFSQELLDILESPNTSIQEIIQKSGISDEVSDANAPENTIKKRAIELGHIFYFGTKYSRGLYETRTKDNTVAPFEMGSYGIGISRTVAALIECFHDTKGICWPEIVAPFQVYLIGVGLHDTHIKAHVEALYTALVEANIDVLYDDRLEQGMGHKLSDAELIGCPWIIIAGRRSYQQGVFELRHRTTGEEHAFNSTDLIQHLQKEPKVLP